MWSDSKSEQMRRYAEAHDIPTIEIKMSGPCPSYRDFIAQYTDITRGRKVYTVVNQYPYREVACFTSLTEAQSFIQSHDELAYPIVTSIFVPEGR